MITNGNTLTLIFYLVCQSSASSEKSFKVLPLLVTFTEMLLTLPSFAKLLHSAFPSSLPCNASRASQQCPNTSWTIAFSDNFCHLFVLPTVEVCFSLVCQVKEEIIGKSSFLFKWLITMLRKIGQILLFSKLITELLQPWNCSNLVFTNYLFAINVFHS